MAKIIRYGLVGMGMIGKTHIHAYSAIPFCFTEPVVLAHPAALLRTDLKRDAAFMQSAGFDFVTTDAKAFFDQPMDFVDVCSPSALHGEYVFEALNKGLPVYCEKPLARDLAEARAFTAAAEKAGVSTHVAFVLRYAPAIRQMKALLAAGAIGDILHFRGHMFHGSYLDPNRPMSWRLRWTQSGGGAFGDLGAHLVDLVHYLLGPVASLQANMCTFIQERPAARGDARREKVDVDDWMHCNLELKSGAVGQIEVTRMAAGSGEDTSFQVFGARGALHFSSAQPDSVRVYDLKKGQWSQGAIDAPPVPGERPLAEIYPPAKYSLGTFTNQHFASQCDLLLSLAEGKTTRDGFAAGLAVQEVIEGAYRSARRGGERIRLPLD